MPPGAAPQNADAPLANGAAEERIKAIMTMKRIPVLLSILALIVSATLITVFAAQPKAASSGEACTLGGSVAQELASAPAEGGASAEATEQGGVLTYTGSGTPLASDEVTICVGAEQDTAYFSVTLDGCELVRNGRADASGVDLTFLRGAAGKKQDEFFLQDARPCRWILRFSDRTLVYVDGELVSDGTLDVDPATVTGDRLTPSRLAAQPETSNVSYAFPLKNTDAAVLEPAGTKTSPDGIAATHLGVDLETAPGTDVLAAADGTVTEAGFRPAEGNYLCIKHADGRETLYQHLSELLVSAGDAVTQGQHIARSGDSGWTTGPHLHFALREGGTYYDPLPLFR